MEHPSENDTRNVAYAYGRYLLSTQYQNYKKRVTPSVYLRRLGLRLAFNNGKRKEPPLFERKRKARRRKCADKLRFPQGMVKNTSYDQCG